MSQKIDSIKQVSSNKEARLLWFVNRLLLLSKKPVTLQNEYDEYICFDIKLLKEEPNLFHLSTEKSKYSYMIEDDHYDDYCVPMLDKIKIDTNYLKIKGIIHSNQPEFYYFKDPCLLQRYCAFVSCEYIPLLEIYLKSLIKESKNNHSDDAIQKIEILEDKSEKGRIKLYINNKYDNGPLDFARKGAWQLMYKVANKEYVAYDKKGKAFYDYFNSNKTNSLYAKHGFKVTTILKREDSEIKPNIEIKIITPNKITRQLKSA